MKFKMFSAPGPDQIVKDVNDWLSPLKGVAIRHTETKLTVTEPKTGDAILLFSVWYDE